MASSILFVIIKWEETDGRNRGDLLYRQPTVQGGFHLLPSREMLLFISYFLFPQTGGSQRRKVKRETRTWNLPTFGKATRGGFSFSSRSSIDSRQIQLLLTPTTRVRPLNWMKVQYTPLSLTISHPKNTQGGLSEWELLSNTWSAFSSSLSEHFSTAPPSSMVESSPETTPSYPAL